MNIKICGIINESTNEVLADNLPFEEIPELLFAYCEFYPNDKIFAFVSEGNECANKIRRFTRNNFLEYIHTICVEMN